jgi:type IV pilus assembly protein PilM
MLLTFDLSRLTVACVGSCAGIRIYAMTSPSTQRQGIRAAFNRFFPPPKFLEMPAVGLDISDDAVSAVGLVRHGAAFSVERFGRRLLPKGSITGGNVSIMDAVVGALRELKHELKLGFVNASLSEESAYLFKTKIPRVPKKEIRGVLEFKLEENVPIPASDAIFDYTIITQGEHESGDHLDVSVTVLPKIAVDTYTKLLEKAALVPLSFEIEAQAISRAVVPKGNRDAHLIVHMGEHQTGLSIVSDEVVHFTSTVGIGGEHITEAIANHLSISRAEAAKIKHEHASFRSKQSAQLFLTITKALSALKDEMSKLSVYWSTHKDNAGELGKKIGKIILCGRDAALPGLADYMALAFEYPVEVGNVWMNACSFEDYIPPISFDESLDYAAAIGLALPKSH